MVTTALAVTSGAAAMAYRTTATTSITSGQCLPADMAIGEVAEAVNDYVAGTPSSGAYSRAALAGYEKLHEASQHHRNCIAPARYTEPDNWAADRRAEEQRETADRYRPALDNAFENIAKTLNPRAYRQAISTLQAERIDIDKLPTYVQNGMLSAESAFMLFDGIRTKLEASEPSTQMRSIRVNGSIIEFAPLKTLPILSLVVFLIGHAGNWIISDDESGQVQSVKHLIEHMLAGIECQHTIADHLIREGTGYDISFLTYAAATLLVGAIVMGSARALNRLFHSRDVQKMDMLSTRIKNAGDGLRREQQLENNPQLVRVATLPESTDGSAKTEAAEPKTDNREEGLDENAELGAFGIGT